MTNFELNWMGDFVYCTGIRTILRGGTEMLIQVHEGGTGGCCINRNQMDRKQQKFYVFHTATSLWQYPNLNISQKVLYSRVLSFWVQTIILKRKRYLEMSLNLRNSSRAGYHVLSGNSTHSFSEGMSRLYIVFMEFLEICMKLVWTTKVSEK